MWNSTVANLSKRYRVIAIDLLGHGLSENLGYLHTMEQMAEAVNEVLNCLKIRKTFLVGHSMGGYVALAYSEFFPDSVKGLCLINSTTRGDSEEKKRVRDRAIKIVKNNHVSFIRGSIPMLFRSKNRKLFRKEINEVKKEALKTSKQGIIAALEGMKIRKDREVLLYFGPFPKLMMIGDKDPVLKLNDLIDQADGTDTEVIRFSEGHMSHIENKEEMIYELGQFIKNN